MFRKKYTKLLPITFLIPVFLPLNTSEALATNDVLETSNQKIKIELTENERQEILNSLDVSDSVSDSELQNLSDVSLQEISTIDGELVSIEKISSYNMNSSTDNQITPFLMPTEHFELSVLAFQTSEKVFKLHAEGEWKVNPNFEFTDVIALAWSDNLTLEDSLAYTLEDQGKGYLERDYTGIAVNKIVPEAGVAYDVDLRLNEDEKFVVLQALVTAPNEPGRAQVVAEYGHQEVTASDVTVGFSAGSDLSIAMDVSFRTHLEMASPASDSFDY